MLCIWSDQLRVIYYEPPQPNETITGEHYQQQLHQLSEHENLMHLNVKRHNKVILQYSNAQPYNAKVIKDTLEVLQWDALPLPPSLPPPCSSDIVPSNYHFSLLMIHGLAAFTSYEEAENWVNSWVALKDKIFFNTEPACYLKDGEKL